MKEEKPKTKGVIRKKIRESVNLEDSNNFNEKNTMI